MADSWQVVSTMAAAAAFLSLVALHSMMPRAFFLDAIIALR
jgi:hypothetical protein